MTGVRIKLSQLENQLKSGQTKPRKEKPASAFLTRWSVCICAYIGDAHTPCLWLLTQSSMNTARVQKLSGESRSSSVSPAECQLQKAAGEERRRGAGVESGWVITRHIQHLYHGLSVPVS